MSSRRRNRNSRQGRGRNRTLAARTVMCSFRKFPAPITIPIKQSWPFQLRNVLTMSTDGSGVLAGVIPGNPNATLSSAFGSVALFPEWTNVAALFSAVRIRQLEITVMSKYVETKGDVPGTIIIATQYVSSSSFPSSYATASDNQDSQMISITNDTSGRGSYHAMKWPVSIAPAATNDPDPTGDALIGAPGGIALYGNTLPISTSIVQILVVGTYDLFNRS
jgi:hypothetical protein